MVSDILLHTAVGGWSVVVSVYICRRPDHDVCIVIISALQREGTAPDRSSALHYIFNRDIGTQLQYIPELHVDGSVIDTEARRRHCCCSTVVADRLACSFFAGYVVNHVRSFLTDDDAMQWRRTAQELLM